MHHWWKSDALIFYPLEIPVVIGYETLCLTLGLACDYPLTFGFAYINDYSNMIWNVEWQILYFDLWFLCRSIINQVYYEYMFMCLCGSFMDDCRSIYGRLITDVTGSLIIRFVYAQVILILFWSVYDHRRYGRAFPIYLGLTTHNGDTCHRVILYCSFVPFGFMSYIRYRYYICHCFIMITLVYILLVIVLNFELWLCSCYLLCNIWCIGTEPYFTQETEEDQAFQTFEPTDEPEWDAGDGFGAVWTSIRVNNILAIL